MRRRSREEMREKGVFLERMCYEILRCNNIGILDRKKKKDEKMRRKKKGEIRQKRKKEVLLDTMGDNIGIVEKERDEKMRGKCRRRKEGREGRRNKNKKINT